MGRGGDSTVLIELEASQRCCDGYGEGDPCRFEEGGAGDEYGGGKVDEVDVLRRQRARGLGGESGRHARLIPLGLYSCVLSGVKGEASVTACLLSMG